MSKPFEIEWDSKANAAENASARLPKLASDYFAFGRELLSANPEPAQLHALRLATKKIRYTLELFQDLYGPDLKARMNALRLVQQLLGDLNDCVAAERTIRETLVASTPQVEGVSRFLHERAVAKANEFRKHWTEVFDASGQERWWADYLARPNGKKAGRQIARPTTR